MQPTGLAAIRLNVNIFWHVFFLPSTECLRTCDSPKPLWILIKLALIQLARTRTDTHTYTEIHTHTHIGALSVEWHSRCNLHTVFLYYSTWQSQQVALSPLITEKMCQPAKIRLSMRSYSYKTARHTHWIAGLCGSCHVFTSNGILSLEASWMTQMFGGFGKRCCCAPGAQFIL